MGPIEKTIQDLEGIRKNYSTLVAASKNQEKLLRREKTQSVILGYSRPSFENIPEEFLGNCIHTILTDSPTFKSLEVAMKKFDELGEKGFHTLSQAIFQIKSCQKKIESNSLLNEQETVKKLLNVIIATFRQYIAPLQTSQIFPIDLSNRHDEMSRLHLFMTAKFTHYDRIISLFLSCSSDLIYCNDYFNNPASIFISPIKEVLPVTSPSVEDVEKKIERSRRSFRVIDKQRSSPPQKRLWQRGKARVRQQSIRILMPYISEESVDIEKESDTIDIVSLKKRIAAQAIEEFIGTIEKFAKKIAAYQKELEIGLAMNFELFTEGAITARPRSMSCDGKRDVNAEAKAENLLLAEQIMLSDCSYLSEIADKVVNNWKCIDIDKNDFSIDAIEEAITRLYMLFYKGPEASPTSEMQLLALLQMACLSSKKNERIASFIYNDDKFPLSKERCWQLFATQTFARLHLPLNELDKAITDISIHPIIKDRLRALIQHLYLLPKMSSLFL